MLRLVRFAHPLHRWGNILGDKGCNAAFNGAAALEVCNYLAIHIHPYGADRESMAVRMLKRGIFHVKNTEISEVQLLLLILILT